MRNSVITKNHGGGIRWAFSLPLPEGITIEGDSSALNGRFDGEEYTNGEASGISIFLNDPDGKVPIYIADNEISRNDFPGIRLGLDGKAAAMYPRIVRSAIFGNELLKTDRTQIRLGFGLDGDQVEDIIVATENYWGAPDPNPEDCVTIHTGIIDGHDTPAIGTKLVITPWLSEWPPP